MANRRKAANLMIDPGALLRLSAPLFFLLGANLLIILTVSQQLSDWITGLDPSLNAKDYAQMTALAASIRQTLNWGLLIEGFVAFGLWLYYSHRFLGPLVPIRRFVNALTQGKKPDPITLRKNDELQELAADLNKLREVINNSRGQSLIQVMVAAAIGLIIMTAMGAAQLNQSRENQSLTEKLALLSLQASVTAAMSDGAVCKYIMNNPSPLTFDSTSVSPDTPQNLSPSLPIYSWVRTHPSLVLGSPVAAVGDLVSSLQSQSMKIKSITLSLTGAPSPLPSPGPGVVFKGDWIVAIDGATAIRALRPVSVSTMVTADTSVPAAAKITACQTVSGGTPGNMSLWGSGNRCKADKISFVCGNNPGNEWNYNVCMSQGHISHYHEQMRWSEAGQGYALITGPCAPNTICPGWGLLPYKADVYCQDGFE